MKQLDFKKLIRIRGKRQKPIKLYRKCNETPLQVFIDCYVHKNLRALIREGSNVSLAELEKAFEELISEYSELTGSGYYKELISSMKEIALLENRINVVRLCLLGIGTDETGKAKSILHKKGYRYEFNMDNKANLKKDIDKVFDKLKTTEVLLNSALLRLDKLQKQTKGSEATEAQFEESLVIISRHMGYRVTKKITVAEFVRMQKLIEFENSSVQKLLNR